MFNKMFSIKATTSVLAATIALSAQAEVVIEEVVVTARKRAESLQSVPDSITAFGASKIESAGIDSVNGFAQLTPNLAIYDNYRPGTARITIRGMITPQVGDAPLAYVVDGVTAPSMDFINQDLFALERIEVLRGPQGALYGKGAIGGAINVITRQPTNELEGEAIISAAEGKTRKMSAFVSGPIVDDSLLFRAGAQVSKSDGHIFNEVLGENTDGYDNRSISGMLTYLINDQASIDLRARHSDNEAGVGYYEVVADASDINGQFERGPTSNIPGSSHRKLSEYSSKFEVGTEITDIHWTVGFSEVSDTSFSDSDYTNLPSDFVTLFAGAQETLYDVEALTSELRFTSNDSSSFDWQVGAFYQDRRTRSTLHLWDDWDGTSRRERDSFDIPEDEYNGDNLDPGFLTEYLFSIVDENTSEAWAVFAQANSDIGDRFNISGALRYDMDDRQSFDERFYAQTYATASFSELQPKVQLSYEVTDGVNVYTSLSRSFRSGGFNEPHPDVQRVFDKEVSDSVELGVKTTFANGRLILNGAVYSAMIDGTQYTRFNVDTFTLENLNISESSSQGMELEMTYVANEQLRLTAGYGYSNATIEAFEDDLQLSGIVGNRVPGVYESSFNVGAQYTYELGGAQEISINLDYIYNGDVYWDIENDLSSSATQFVNARLSYEIDRVALIMFAENLTNERTLMDAFALDYGYGRQVNRPRIAGLELRYSF